MSEYPIEKPVLVLLGPTAVGKTALSLDIAERYDGEIVSVDSMQVYRYMDIGTAKPTIDERRGVPHHLLDIVSPDQPYDAASFARDADAAISAIHNKKRLPILVGGTGLYLRAALHGLFPAPKIDEQLRQRLRERIDQEGVSRLYQELCKIDPDSAQRIAASDRQRILRALEIFYSTGQPWSVLLKQQDGNCSPTSRYSCILQVGLHCERDVLYQRIDKRCRLMLESGLEAEVRHLKALGYPRSLKAMGSIGYRHMLDYLDGKYNQEEMLELMRRDTRRYAKRQGTWFGKDKSIQWVTASDHDAVFATIERWLKQIVPSLAPL